MATNTSKSIKEAPVTTAELDQAVKDAARVLGEAKLIKVRIPKFLKDRLGPMLPVGINGAMIYIPVDGEEYEIPAPYKAIIDESINNLSL